MAKVAFIGLGVMGYPMAGWLTKAGHEVTVYNRTAAKAEKWAAEYGHAFKTTPAEAAHGCDFVMACVGNDDDLRQVTIGQNGAFEQVKPGAVFVDHTTASAAVARELHADAMSRGFAFVDAPVSGGSGRRREWPAHRDVRRRHRSLWPRRAGDHGLRQGLQAPR